MKQYLYLLIFFLISATKPNYFYVDLTVKYKDKVYKDFSCAVVELKGNKARIIPKQIKANGPESFIVLVSKKTLSEAEKSFNKNKDLFLEYKQEILADQKAALEQKKLEMLDKQRGILPARDGLEMMFENKEPLIFDKNILKIFRHAGRKLTLVELRINGKEIDLKSIADYLKFYEYGLHLEYNKITFPSYAGVYNFQAVAEFEGEKYRVPPITLTVKHHKNEEEAYNDLDEFSVREFIEYKGYQDEKQYLDFPFEKYKAFIEKHPNSHYSKIIKSFTSGVLYQYLVLNDQSILPNVLDIAVLIHGKDNIIKKLNNYKNNFKRFVNINDPKSVKKTEVGVKNCEFCLSLLGTN